MAYRQVAQPGCPGREVRPTGDGPSADGSPDTSSLRQRQVITHRWARTQVGTYTGECTQVVCGAVSREGPGATAPTSIKSTQYPLLVSNATVPGGTRAPWRNGLF